MTANDVTCRIHRGPANVRRRRVSPHAVHPDESRLTELGAVISRMLPEWLMLDPIESSEEDWSYLTFLFALLTIVFVPIGRFGARAIWRHTATRTCTGR